MKLNIVKRIAYAFTCLFGSEEDILDILETKTIQTVDNVEPNGDFEQTVETSSIDLNENKLVVFVIDGKIIRNFIGISNESDDSKVVNGKTITSANIPNQINSKFLIGGMECIFSSMIIDDHTNTVKEVQFQSNGYTISCHNLKHIILSSNEAGILKVKGLIAAIAFNKSSENLLDMAKQGPIIGGVINR